MARLERESRDSRQIARAPLPGRSFAFQEIPERQPSAQPHSIFAAIQSIEFAELGSAALLSLTTSALALLPLEDEPRPRSEQNIDEKVMQSVVVIACLASPHLGPIMNASRAILETRPLHSEELKEQR